MINDAEKGDRFGVMVQYMKGIKIIYAELGLRIKRLDMED